MVRRTSSRKATTKRIKDGLDGSETPSHTSSRRRHRTKKTGTAKSTANTIGALETTKEVALGDGSNGLDHGPTGSIDAAVAPVHGDTTDHPTDCTCYLRYLSKDLFLPPSLMIDDKKDGGSKR